jgi:hypothetical protein
METQIDIEWQTLDFWEYVVNANWGLRPQISEVVNRELQAFVLSNTIRNASVLASLC